MLILTWVYAASACATYSALRQVTSITHRVPLLVEWDEGGVVDLDDRTPRVVDERELARIRFRLTKEVDVTCEPTTACNERPPRPS